MSINPYHGLGDFHFWRKAMTDPAPGHIDTVRRSALIEPHHKVATLGSCFAQQIARHIMASGLQHYDAEPAPPGMPTELARAHGYGVFSARYGNVYTVRQALQLFDRAFGAFRPQEAVWAQDGRYVDAFRPAIEPGAWAHPDDVLAEADRHLACVRQLFCGFDWLVFTLGMTEAWRSRQDGAVYPMAPGVAGGSFDATRHEFVNFSAGQVSADLNELVTKIASVNPKGRILLTVSPVPIIATYENRHVWVASTVTKARLRVAADEAEHAHLQVMYFPSYEVITSPAAGNRYYADDLRQVTEAGVKHVMRLFSRHFMQAGPPAATASNIEQDLKRAQLHSDVVCEEELIAASLENAQPGGKA